MRQVERAIFDLRSGHPILLRLDTGAMLAQAIEGLDAESLFILRAQNPELGIVLTRHRLAALRPDLPVHSDLIRVRIPGDFTVENMVELVAAHKPEFAAALTAEDLSTPSVADRAALKLARRGRLLPAVVTAAVKDVPAVESLVSDGTLLALDATKAEAGAIAATARVVRISEASVPLAGAEETRFILFREAAGNREHLALLIGDPDAWPQPVSVRLHSACLTGDLFGSLRCDCGEQLRSGVENIARCGGGILLYLAQEGRDIGLANKLRAYSLQDTGLDTVDADQVLGFSEDERHYSMAVEMLQNLGIDQIALLTNNPSKINAMRQGGIEVLSRQALHGQVNNHNRRYLSAKASRSGHWLEELLEEGPRQGSNDVNPPKDSSAGPARFASR